MKYTGRTGWVASKKDTWDLQEVFNPIILAGLQKFTAEKRYGVPGAIFVEVKDTYTTEDTNEASVLWEQILQDMIYAFKNEKPDLDNYDFEFYWTLANSDIKVDMKDIPPNTGMNILSTNETELARYRADEKAHEIKVQNGLDLFAKYYNCLWN